MIPRFRRYHPNSGLSAWQEFWTLMALIGIVYSVGTVVVLVILWGAGEVTR